MFDTNQHISSTEDCSSGNSSTPSSSHSTSDMNFWFRSKSVAVVLVSGGARELVSARNNT